MYLSERERALLQYIYLEQLKQHDSLTGSQALCSSPGPPGFRQLRDLVSPSGRGSWLDSLPSGLGERRGQPHQKEAGGIRVTLPDLVVGFSLTTSTAYGLTEQVAGPEASRPPTSNHLQSCRGHLAIEMGGQLGNSYSKHPSRATLSAATPGRLH